MRRSSRPFHIREADERESIQRKYGALPHRIGGAPGGAQQIEAFKQQPVSAEQQLHGPQRRARIASRRAGAIRGNQSEQRHFRPLESIRDEQQRGRKRRQRDHGNSGDTGGRNRRAQRRESNKVGESCHGLRFVAQRVQDHSRRHRQQQSAAQNRIVDHLRGVHCLHRISGEVQRRPTAAQQSARKNSIARLLLHPESAAQHCEAYGQPDGRAASRAHFGERIAQEQRNADHQHQYAQLVQPTAAHHRFPLFPCIDSRTRCESVGPAGSAATVLKTGAGIASGSNSGSGGGIGTEAVGGSGATITGSGTNGSGSGSGSGSATATGVTGASTCRIARSSFTASSRSYTRRVSTGCALIHRHLLNPLLHGVHLSRQHQPANE